MIKEDGTLEIAAVRASDVGLYTCMVCFDFGLNKLRFLNRH